MEENARLFNFYFRLAVLEERSREEAAFEETMLKNL